MGVPSASAVRTATRSSVVLRVSSWLPRRFNASSRSGVGHGVFDDRIDGTLLTGKKIDDGSHRLVVVGSGKAGDHVPAGLPVDAGGARTVSSAVRRLRRRITHVVHDKSPPPIARGGDLTKKRSALADRRSPPVVPPPPGSNLGPAD